MATEIRRFTAEPVQLKWSVYDHEARAWMQSNHPRAEARRIARLFNEKPAAAKHFEWVPLAEVREMEVVGHGR